MARPRKDAREPSGKERIEEAFWQLFEQRPFSEISVKEVCELAGCNKTTFYYHFHDLREVLDSVEMKCIPLEAPDALPGLLAPEDKMLFISSFISSLGDRFERYCLLISSRGDPGFAKVARAQMIDRWCAKLGVSRESLSSEDLLTIRFIAGGSTSILADHGDGEPFDMEAFADVLISVALPLASRLMRK